MVIGKILNWKFQDSQNGKGLPTPVFHLGFWICFWVIQSLLMSRGNLFSIYLVKNIPIVFLQATIVYLNTFWLFPLLFQKRKYVAYFLISAIVIYLIFSTSFYFIRYALSTVNVNVSFLKVEFTLDFWKIISGASFYYLAFFCSTLFMIIKQKNTDGTDSNNTSETKTIEIKDGNIYHKVNLSTVLFVKGMNEYVQWHTTQGTYTSLDTLKRIEKEYKNENLVRVHKSFIANAAMVTAKDAKFLHFKNKQPIPIGRAYKEQIKGRI